MPDELPGSFRQALHGIHLENGWYQMVATIRHRGQNGMATLPLQVINGTMRAVTEYMVGFDETDRQVKSSVPIDPRQLQKVPPMMGGDYFYQGQIVVPDSVDLATLGNEGETEG